MTEVSDICETDKKIIESTLECIDDLKSYAGKVKTAMEGVPSDYTGDTVSGTAEALPGKLDNDMYDDVKNKLVKCKNNAEKLISAADTGYARQMDEVTRQTGRIREVIDSLLEFMTVNPITMPKERFQGLLAMEETRWKKILSTAETSLEKVMANAKGAEKISTTFSKDPVNLSTGNFIYGKEDLKINGQGKPFIFRRFYNAINGYEGVLGADWNTNYEIRLTFKKSEVFEKEEATVMLADGKEEHFLPADEEHYTAENQSLAMLKKSENGYIYESINGERYIFDTKGRYERFEDNNGQGYTLYYGENDKKEEITDDTEDTRKTGITDKEYTSDNDGKESLLTRIEKDTGEYFVLTYKKTEDTTEKYYLHTVTDHTGRTVTYEIKDGYLITVIRPDKTSFTYSYSGSGKLAAVKNPRGIITVENEFDSMNRTTLQRFPDGTEMCYEYDDENKSIIHTERNGSKSIHYHDEKYRNIKNVYPDGEESFAYNTKNQKIRITDKNGNTTNLTYDNRGNLTGIINPLGTKSSITYNGHNRPMAESINGKEKIRNSYDAKGNLIETKDALNRKTTISYDELGRPVRITAPDNSHKELTYDTKGNITEIKNEQGNTIRYTYDELNRVSTVTDAKGNTETFLYDVMGNIIWETNAEGKTRKYRYNKSGKVTEIEDFDKSIIKREYNVLNKPSKITDKEGRVTKLTYDSMWNLARITAPDGGTTTYLYNENNRLGRIKDALGNVTRYTYDGMGNRLSVTDAEGAKTTFTYDALGRMTSAKDPEGNESLYEYDDEGNLTKVTDALGNEVNRTFDICGQLIKEETSAGESRIYTYDALGNVETVTTEAGLMTAYSYLPGSDKVTEIRYPDGTYEKISYDANGNVESRTNAGGYTLSYHYDSLNRLVKVTGGEGESKEYTYDAVGNVTSMTDTLGNVTKYEYSLNGKLTKVTDAAGGVAEYTYDENDRLTGILQTGDEGAVPRRTEYKRNILGQVESVTDALGNEEHYKYNNRGELTEKTDKEGYLTKYGYTKRGDVNHILYEDGREVMLSYDALRHLTEIKDWLGKTVITNDAKGRATKVTYPDGRHVSYSYNISGQRTGLTYPDGRHAEYIYDENKRLTELIMYEAGEVSDPEKTYTLPEDRADRPVPVIHESADNRGMVRKAASGIHYGYDGLGRLAEKIFPNGITTTYLYDKRGLLTKLTHKDKEGILDEYEYTYDKAANRTEIKKNRRGLHEESGTYSYGYDAIGRLSRVSKDGELLREYGYDTFGNRTSLNEYNGINRITTDYTYNEMNQLIKKAGDAGVEEYTYDRRGNLTEVISGEDIKNSYIYGAINRLEQAGNKNGNAAKYIYNGLGHRVGKEEYGAVPMPEKKINYLTDLTRQYYNLLEADIKEPCRSQNRISSKYKTGEEEIYPSQAIQSSKRQTFWWDGNVAGMTDDGGSFDYYLQDELGSPIRFTDSDGEVAESYGYDEFGADIYGNQGMIQPFGYTGYQADAISGTYFAQAREYDAGVGRFVGEDLIAGLADIPFTMNKYTYCLGNPEKFVDNNGLWPTLNNRSNRDGDRDRDRDRDRGIWSLKNDKQGREILWHYLYGNGSTWVCAEGEWGEYMKNNEILKQKVAKIVFPYADDLEEGEIKEINIITSMEIDNGEDIIGYQYLHGTNADAGGFQIKGNIRKDSNGNVLYDLEYTWNDIIDPNYSYDSDSVKARFAKIIPFANPTDYEIHISFSDITTISNSNSSGWLADMYNECIE